MDNKHITDLKIWVDGLVFQESNGQRFKRSNKAIYKVLNKPKKVNNQNKRL